MKTIDVEKQANIIGGAIKLRLKLKHRVLKRSLKSEPKKED